MDMSYIEIARQFIGRLLAARDRRHGPCGGDGHLRLHPPPEVDRTRHRPVLHRSGAPDAAAGATRRTATGWLTCSRRCPTSPTTSSKDEDGFIEDAVQAALGTESHRWPGYPSVPGGVLHGPDERPAPESGRVRECSRESSGFSLVDVINIRETQGFVCKRNVADEPPYLVLAFRGTEKKISDWLTDARCIPASRGKDQGPHRIPGRVHEERRCRGKNGGGTGPGDTRSAGGQG